MDKPDIKPKKSMGQNFLQDKKALAEIIKAGDLKANDNVLEIGPGTGNLTKEILKKTNKIITVEKDEWLANKLKVKSLPELLRKSRQAGEKLKVVEGDILKINLPKLIEENDFYDYKVIANIPYYITGKILRLLLETKYKPFLAVLLVQKEVAERVCAKKGKMNILAVSVQFYGRPEICGLVSGDKFYPRPEVDSAILKIKLKSPEELVCKTPEAIADFFKTVRIGFAGPRKTLLNNLSGGFGKSKQEISMILMKLEIDKKTRAQDLGLKNWKDLSEQLN